MEFIVWLKKPCLNELDSPEVPAYPPPTVIPGNSITTGGINPCRRVASTSRSMGTFGSTETVREAGSTWRTLESGPVSTTFLRVVVGRVLLVEPWEILNCSFRS
ncbi:hypothetical protein AA313_de0201224 [Arthrobotrys entomopaga]|nr:hypothetical protein AA313_de0201224 [Arthrobotrys entomopaga]